MKALGKVLSNWHRHQKILTCIAHPFADSPLALKYTNAISSLAQQSHLASYQNRIRLAARMPLGNAADPMTPHDKTLLPPPPSFKLALPTFPRTTGRIGADFQSRKLDVAVRESERSGRSITRGANPPPPPAPTTMTGHAVGADAGGVRGRGAELTEPCCTSGEPR